MAPSPALFGFDPALGVCSSGADALGERLRYSLPVMSESGAPIYPSDSKSVLSYSRKNKVGKLDKHLLAEALETFSAPKVLSRPACGVVSKPLSAPAKSTAAQDEGYQPILRPGFLLQAARLFLRQKWEWFHSLRSSLCLGARLYCLSQRWAILLGEVVLRRLVILLGQRLISGSVLIL
jgi:hypothetical protein